MADREHTSVEFKRQVPPKKDPDARLKVTKTVCAFANRAGGSVLIGVDDKDRSYFDITPQTVDEFKAQLDQMVRTSVYLDPHPFRRPFPLPTAT